MVAEIQVVEHPEASRAQMLVVLVLLESSFPVAAVVGSEGAAGLVALDSVATGGSGTTCAIDVGVASIGNIGGVGGAESVDGLVGVVGIGG
jgi:hypothetical protein